MVTTDVREKQSMGTSRGSFLSWRLTHSDLYWLRDECFLCFHAGPRRRVVLNTHQGSGVHRGEDTVHTINTPALSWITAMSDWCLSSHAPAQKGQLLRPGVSSPLKSQPTNRCAAFTSVQEHRTNFLNKERNKRQQIWGYHTATVTHIAHSQSSKQQSPGSCKKDF